MIIFTENTRMYKLTCKACESVFERPYKDRQFCSRVCFDANRPKRSEESKEKIRNITKNHYLTASAQDKKKRWDSIWDAKRKTFTACELKRIENVLSWGYVHDYGVLLKHAGVEDKSRKVFWNFINKNKEWYEKHKGVLFVPKKIQLWTKEKFDNFRLDAENLDHRSIEKKYNIGKKSFKSLSELLGIKWNWIDVTHARKSTKPEKMVKEILEDLRIPFKKEKYIMGTKYRCDFLLDDNKVLEVQGDYWHANPEVFDYGNLTSVQKSNVIRDVQKHRDLLANSFQLLEVWEKDLYERKEEVIIKIKEYAKR